MKQLSYILLASLTLTLFAPGLAVAREKKKAPGAPTAEVSTTTSSGGSSESLTRRIGVGLSSINMGGVGPGLSVWADLKNGMSLQGLAAVGTTSPFTFGVGGIVRGNIAGNQQVGLHVGGGLNLGTANVAGGSAFNVAFGPMGGFHFEWPDASNIGISLDGGALLTIMDGSVSFQTGGLSSLLGLSVHYFF